MKQVLDLRPVYHRREDRIRAYVLLCWLALLLIRVAETAAGGPLSDLEPDRSPSCGASTPVAFTPARPAPSGGPPKPGKPQRDVLAALGLDPPKKIIEEISAKP